MRRSMRMTAVAAAILGVMAAAPAVARAGCLWEQSVPQAIGGAFPTWNAVVAVSPTDGWLFGDTPSGMEHWDGVSWTGAPSPIQPSAADATGYDDVWQIGADPVTGEADSMHYDGSVWTEQPMVNPAGGVTQLDAVSAISPTVAYAAGSFIAPHQYVSAVERWDGTSWVHAPRAPGLAVTKLAAISRHDIWTLLQYPKDHLSSTALAHWDGHSWTIVRPYPSGDFVTLSDVSARSRDDVWAVGSTPTESVTYHFDGVSWTQVAVPPLPHGRSGLLAVSAAKRTATIAVGYEVNRPLILRFARGAWHVEHSAIRPGAFFGVAGVPGTTEAWAFGRYADPVAHRGC